MSIEEEKERVFLKKITKSLKTAKYYIGLEKEQNVWRWLSNGKSVHASKGKHPWASNEPNGDYEIKCATIYGNYKAHLDGLLDDMSCSYRAKDTGYICERAVSCTKEGKGMGLGVQEVSFRRRRTRILCLLIQINRFKLMP